MEIINDVNGLFEFQDLGARTELKNKANLIKAITDKANNVTVNDLFNDLGVCVSVGDRLVILKRWSQ